MHTQKILLIKKGYNSKLIFFQIFSQKKSKKLIKKINQKNTHRRDKEENFLLWIGTKEKEIKDYKIITKGGFV